LHSITVYGLPASTDCKTLIPLCSLMVSIIALSSLSSASCRPPAPHSHYTQPEEASTHKSAKTHVDNVSVTHDCTAPAAGECACPTRDGPMHSPPGTTNYDSKKVPKRLGFVLLFLGNVCSHLSSHYCRKTSQRFTEFVFFRNLQKTTKVG